MTSAHAVAVAAYGLPSEHRFPDVPLDDTTFDALLGECEHHRIVGLLGAAIRNRAFPVTQDQRARAESTWQRWLSHALRVERLVLEASGVLADHGVRSIVLKGVALAHTDYPEPSWRVFGDVDLLVQPHDFTRSANILVSKMGAERLVPELRRGFDDRFGKEILVRVRDLEFDLHRMFVEGPYGATIQLDDLWRAPEPFSLADRPLLALGPPERVLHAAYAAALGDWPPRLNSLRDFAEIVAGNRAHLGTAMQLARSWQCGAVVRLACEYAHDVLGTDISGLALPSTSRESTRDRVFLSTYRGHGRGYLYNFVAPLTIHGVRNKVRYAYSVAFPDATYLAARSMNRMSFARQAWAKVRAGRHAG